jgi:predicted RNase H-like HicB family nuclease
MRYLVEVEREEEGGWLAEVREMPGAVAFGETREEALRAAEALVLRTLADQLAARPQARHHVRSGLKPRFQACSRLHGNTQV